MRKPINNTSGLANRASSRLAKNSVWTFISKGIIFLARFSIGILVSRTLGPEGKGVIHLLITAISIGMLLGNFGIGPASIYFIGKDRKCLPSILGNTLALTAGVGAFVISIGWLLIQSGLLDKIAELPTWMWMMAVCLVPLYILRSLLFQILSAVLRIKEINIVQVTTLLIRLLLTAIFIIPLDGGLSGALIAYALSDVLALIGFSIMVLRYVGRPAKPDWVLFGQTLHYGGKSYLAHLMRHLNLRLDTVLIASLAVQGMHATGIYSVASNLAELIIFIPESIRLTLFPMVASGNETEGTRLTQAACRHTMFLTLVCTLGLACIGPFLLQALYGQAFSEAIMPLLILLPGTMLLSQAHIFYGYFLGQGRPGVTTIMSLGSLIVTVVLDLILIPKYSVVGAAIASTCAYTIEFLIGILFFLRYSRVSWHETLLPRKSDLVYYVTLFQSTVGKRFVNNDNR